MSDAPLMPSQRSQSKFTPKQIATFFFKPCLTEDGDPTGLQICKACGKTRKHAPKTTNLVSHVHTNHPRYELEMEDASTTATGTLLPWGENMESLTEAVEGRVSKEMLDNFELMLDGWTHGSEHYLAVFGCYETSAGPRYPLLSLAPIVVDASGRFDAENPYGCFGGIPAVCFGKDLSNCLFLVGDNCAVNMRLARLMGVPLVGCASHLLNLAVRTLLDPHEKELEQVQSLIKRLRALTLAAKLR
ncbi:hypothetical protein JG688_00010056 [Phytophthora aleatoria]|uniref:BED-type domain-containing protein n=1 Tax=Phytophthora aleatoria TaxID=2496075 RepID=A0A8J5IFH9_9STRA|nr:hypothetical protein JG688_00010056 [Phytophthora aleatoria]